MSIELRFLSAVVLKADIAAHYPGGCAAFETQHRTGAEDDELYALFAMSGVALDECLDAIRTRGFDTDRFIAIGDMWHGAITQAPGIRFYSASQDTFPAAWLAAASEASHD